MLSKKAALIMFTALLIVTVAGCGSGGGVSYSSTSTGETGGTGGTADTGGSTGGTNPTDGSTGGTNPTDGSTGGTNPTGGSTGGTGPTGGSAGGTNPTGGAVTRSATLAWNAPTTNTDGTPLTDLAGYKIYYGTSSGNYTSAIDVGNTTTYTVANLSPGAYYFSVTSYDISGIESAYSNEASKTIQ